METIRTKSGILPNFSESDIEILKKYYEYNQNYYVKLNALLTADLYDHPLWGPIIKSMTPEMLKQQNERSQELQRAAIYDGKWEEYSNDLLLQGVTYARMNISYTEWYELIKMYKNYLLPYIKKDFNGRTEEAIVFLEGLSMFLDFAMYGIAEAYFNEKNNIIRAKEESFRAIFENSADYIFLIDRDTRINMINHVDSRYTVEDVIGKSMLSFHEEENKAIVKRAIDQVFETKTPTNFDIYSIINEKKEYYSSSVSPVFDAQGEVSAAVVISRNITMQKLAEDEIKELNATLERKVEERTEELKNINKELEAFSYSVSHDLRSPLRAINGFTQILADDYSNIMNDEAKDAMQEIIKNTSRMGQLIDDLLEFSRIGKQGIIKGNIDMNELTAFIVSEIKNTGVNKNIEFNIKPLEKVKGDRGMLKQVMYNLISNAVKYSSKVEKPVIEIGFYAEGNSNIYYVKDNGAGFDMTYYNKLFGVFQRLHSSNEFEGTGVGLAIVQRTIMRHSGKVWAEGKVGNGATFYISLPNS